jgi:hypothetical protein
MTTNTPKVSAPLTLNTPERPDDSALAQDTRRHWVAAGLTLLAIVLMVIAAVLYKPANRLIENPPLIEATVLALLGGLSLLGALILSPHKVEAGQVAETELSEGAIRWRLLIPGLALLAIGIEMSANVLKLPAFQFANPTLQFLLLLAGLGLFLAGMIGVRRLSRPTIHWRAALPLIGIVALAFFVRAFQLDTLIRFSVDEMHFAIGADAFFNRFPPDLLTTTSTYLPPAMIYSYWNAGTVALWGHNFVGLRMLNAILGTATVLAAYGATRAMFDRRTALIAALLVATFPPHIHFSRISMGQVGDALFGTMAIMFAARAFRWNRRADWVLFGTCLGLTQYFYEGGRLLFPPLFIGWFALILLVLRSRLRPLRRGLGLALVTLIVVILPVYFTMWYTGAPFGSRMNESQTDTSVFGRALRNELNPSEQAALGRRLSDPFLVYVFNPDGTGEFYSGQEPMVLRIFVPLFLLGVFHSIWRIKSATTLLVPALIGASAGNILIANPMMFHRYIMVMPAVAILVAIGLRCTLPMLNPFVRRDAAAATPKTAPARRRIHAAAALTFALAGVIAGTQLYYYFNHLIPEHNISGRAAKPYRDGSDAVWRTLAIPGVDMDTWHIYLLDRQSPDVHVPRHIIGFVHGMTVYPLEAMETTALTQRFYDSLPRDRTYVFFVEPADTRTLRFLTRSFNLEGPFYTPYNDMPVNKAYLMFIARLEDNLQPRGQAQEAAALADVSAS